MKTDETVLVLVPKEEWQALLSIQKDILNQIKDIQSKGQNGTKCDYITAKEFMAAVRIGRTKFDQLVHESKIRTVKKRRKIYVPKGEVGRYFSDNNIM